MYAGTGISTDSARRKKSKTWARWTARQCRKAVCSEADAGTDFAGVGVEEAAFAVVAGKGGGAFELDAGFGVAA
jgi:hypothetical protein